MNNKDFFAITILPQYVKYTDVNEKFKDGNIFPLHEVQKRIKLDFESLPEFTIITAPTGTGKSYAFPFPILNFKKNPIAFKESFRGLIVLPTNALINELHSNFYRTYHELKVNKVTGEELNKRAVKGFDRWTTILKIAGESDLVITNPDIINYAMHGGYHKNYYSNKTGRKEFANFLSFFDYIIFDEYHLYDESQIANILTLVYLRDLILQQNARIKYFFVSATPEPALQEILKNNAYDFEEIIEHITNDSERARAIHGEIVVEFYSSKDVNKIAKENLSEIGSQKALIILDSLREVQVLASELQSLLPDLKVYQSTGYIPKEENDKEKIEKAQVVVATNKAEVGVNYDVNFCIMQTGKYYQNFIQRFGRVARGDLKGKVLICLDNVTFNQFQKLFNNNEVVEYYDFVTKAKSILQSKKFYTETIPFYQGEYIWCIENTIWKNQSYENREYIKKRLKDEEFFKQGKQYSRYKLFNEVNSKIEQLVRRFPNGETTNAWKGWWNKYLDTYLTFRDASKIVRIIDKNLDIELSYSLDWILQHKEIISIENHEVNGMEVQTYTVGSLKDRDKNLQYQISTIPSVRAKENEFVSYTEMFEINKVFQRAVKLIQDKRKKGVDEIDTLQVELLDKIKELASTFNKKRLMIEDIRGNDNSNFL